MTKFNVYKRINLMKHSLSCQLALAQDIVRETVNIIRTARDVITIKDSE